MDHKQIVATRLAAVGIALSESDLEQLAAVYPKLLQWERIVSAMVQPETEPALTFRAQEEG